MYVKFRNAAYEKIYLDLLESSLKIKLKAHSQFSKKFVDKFWSPSLSAFNHLNYLFWVAAKVLATCFV